MTLLDWLRLGRPHTASLTIPGALLGVAAAGGGPWHVWLGVALWALWFHYVGFLMNGLADLEHDRRDPSKAHFPLVTGVISVRAADRVFVWGTALGLAAAGLIGGRWEALLPAFFATAFGIAYNLRSKRTLVAPFYISMAFAFIPLYGYLAAGGAFPVASPLAWLLFAYGFCMTFFQIAVSGYLKELPQVDQPNLLRRTGWDVLPVQLEPFYTSLFLKPGNPWPYLARVPCLVLAPVIAVLLLGGFWPSVALSAALSLLGIGIVSVTATELRAGRFDRPRRVRLMAVNEILAYWFLVVAMAPLLGVLGTLAFVVLPLAWFVAWNKLLWNSYVAPRV